jgi:hypothetical protein
MPPNCKFRCLGCSRENPEPPIEKTINGIPCESVRPSCHHESAQGAFVRAGLSLSRRALLNGESLVATAS